MSDWQTVANAADIIEGKPSFVYVDEQRIGLYRLGDEVFAIGDICTHAYAHLSEGYLDGDTIECPMHQACFSIRTGKALCAPADEDVPTWPIEISDGQVRIRI